MAAINFPTATSNGQTFTADTGVIYTYIGTPPNGFWSGTFGTTGLATLDARFVALNDGNSIQTMQTQGLKFNNGTADTILLDGVNGKVGIGTTSPSNQLDILSTTSGATVNARVGSIATSGANNANLIINNGGTGNGTLRFDYEGVANHASIGVPASTKALLFNTDGSERMRLDASGNLGVGASPSFASFGSNTGGIHIKDVGSGSTGIKIENGSNHLHLMTSGSKNFIHSGSNIPLSISTNGSERLVIDSSGNVGISRNAPANQLSIGSTASFETDGNSFYLGSNFTGTGQNFIGSNKHAQRLFFNNATNNGYLSYANTGSAGTAGNAITWQERLRIDSSGRLLLGTTSPGPAGGEQLTIADSSNAGITIRSGTSAAGSILFEDDTADRGELQYSHNGDYMRFKTAGTERMRIDSSGRVGMGASSPVDRLHIKDSNSGGDIGLRVQNNTSGANSTASIHLTTSGTDGFNSATIKTERTSGALIFERDGNERMRIDNSGNVGVGGNPTVFGGQNFVSIHSPGSSTNVAGLDFYVSSTRESGFLSYPGIGESLRIFANTARAITIHNNGAERMRIDSSGNVGIGRNNPGEKLDILSTSGDCAIKMQAPAGSVSHINAIGSNILAFETGFVEKMRIDDPGRVLIGTSSSVGTFSGISPRLQLEGTSYDSATASIYQNNIDAQTPAILVLGKSRGSSVGSNTGVAAGDRVGVIEFNGADGTTRGISLGNIAGFVDDTPGTNDMPGRLVFSTTADGASSPTERMRITCSGHTCFGITSHKVSSSSEQGHFIGAPGSFAGFTRASNTVVYVNRISTDGNLIEFRRNGADKGSISVSGSSTSYNTSSDYRLKENVVDLTAAIPRLKSLSVYRFNFIEDTEKTVDGFLAHEAQLVVPEAVTGTHNEVDGDGNPVMQSIDQAKLVPLLTAALQEAIGRIETLETEVAALKAG